MLIKINNILYITLYTRGEQIQYNTIQYNIFYSLSSHGIYMKSWGHAKLNSVKAHTCMLWLVSDNGILLIILNSDRYSSITFWLIYYYSSGRVTFTTFT